MNTGIFAERDRRVKDKCTVTAVAVVSAAAVVNAAAVIVVAADVACFVKVEQNKPKQTTRLSTHLNAARHEAGKNAQNKSLVGLACKLKYRYTGYNKSG